MIDSLHFLNHVIIHLYDAHRSGHISMKTWLESVRLIERAYYLCGGDLYAQINAMHAKREEILRSQVENVRQDKFNFYPGM